jgi:quercetin dioxygenase-like cupin family protein
MFGRAAPLITMSVLLAPVAHADEANQPTVAPAPTVRVVSNQQVPNIPGKSLETLLVSFGPGAVSSAHRHAGSAFMTAYVQAGAIRVEIEGEPSRVYHAGDTWYEQPGAHHLLSKNVSDTEPATLLAILLMDTGDEPLTVYDTNRTQG